jgi:hypothetical protein
MTWEVRVQYANGKERVLRICKNREIALRYVDAIYSQGYPMHIAYIVCPVPETELFQLA